MNVQRNYLGTVNEPSTVAWVSVGDGVGNVHDPALFVPVSMYEPAESCLTLISIFPVSETTLSVNPPCRVIPAGLQNMKFLKSSASFDLRQ